jgi:hypothetical protein
MYNCVNIVIVYRQATIKLTPRRYLCYLPYTAWSLPKSLHVYAEALHLHPWKCRYYNSLIGVIIVEPAPMRLTLSEAWYQGVIDNCLDL